MNLIAAPLTHGASCFVCRFWQWAEHTRVEEPKPPRVLDAIESYRVTTMYAPPTLLYGMMSHPGVETRDYTTLRHVIYSAAPMRAGQIRDASACSARSSRPRTAG